jgi:hypothetical protein
VKACVNNNLSLGFIGLVISVPRDDEWLRNPTEIKGLPPLSDKGAEWYYNVIDEYFDEWSFITGKRVDAEFIAGIFEISVETVSIMMSIGDLASRFEKRNDLYFRKKL